VRVTYFAGLAAHLLRRHPDVADVKTLAEAGITGPAWHPSWLLVTMRDGTSMVLNAARQASDTESGDKPDLFSPEDIDERQREVSGLRSGHVG
jgi:hypothetical protein